MTKEALIIIVTAAQQGDGDALNTLFQEYYNDVYYFALKTVKNNDLACDITQETFLEIFNTIRQLQEPAAFVTWMKRITYHQCTRYFKKKKDVLVEENEEGASVFDTLEETNEDFIPAEALDKDDFRKTILAMIDELSEEQRAAVIMYYFDELSVKQIAAIQGVSEGTIKSRLNYARKAIKASVEEYETKNGIKLHSFSILPFLLWLFGGEKAGISLPPAVVESISAATAEAVGTTAASTVATATTTTAAAGTGAAATAGVATAGAVVAKASIPLAVKIIAGIAAVVVTASGAAGAVHFAINNNDNKKPVRVSDDEDVINTIDDGDDNDGEQSSRKDIVDILAACDGNITASDNTVVTRNADGSYTITATDEYTYTVAGGAIIRPELPDVDLKNFPHMRIVLSSDVPFRITMSDNNTLVPHWMVLPIDTSTLGFFPQGHDLLSYLLQFQIGQAPAGNYDSVGSLYDTYIWCSEMLGDASGFDTSAVTIDAFQIELLAPGTITISSIYLYTDENLSEEAPVNPPSDEESNTSPDIDETHSSTEETLPDEPSILFP